MCDIATKKIDGKHLMELAKKAKGDSYSPYSNFPVGAAVLTDEGKIYTGANIENASYGASICAERVAIYKAINSGARRISAIAICANKNKAFPCGICRQVMSEFTHSEDIEVFVEKGESEIEQYKLSQLLPNAFKL